MLTVFIAAAIRLAPIFLLAACAVPVENRAEPAAAVEAPPPPPPPAAPVIDLASWTPPDPAAGWSARRLIATAVYGASGDRIGRAANLIVGPDGNLSTLVVESSGMLAPSGTRFAVPWNSVRASADRRALWVPTDPGTLSLYGLDPEHPPGPRPWRVTELMGDYALLQGNVPYGVVDDLIFDDARKLVAVVIAPDATRGGRGHRVLPFYGYDAGFDPGHDSYKLPYDRNAVEALPLLKAEAQ